ncbi:sigma 54-interacting transcriptional regulator [Clostridiaceae bacterium M8S5]|nr:sigma 54-interacting transcriptional regulator [Clostridiaceae bacterium M8S5]
MNQTLLGNNIGFVLTDADYNIIDYNSVFNFLINGNNQTITKPLTYYYPKLLEYTMNDGIVVDAINNNKKIHIIGNKINVNNSTQYIFFFTDFSVKYELADQIKYLNEHIYFYNEMFNKLLDGIYITDEYGKTLYVNDAFINLSGLSRDVLLGKNVYELRKEHILPNSCCMKVIEDKAPVSTINNYYKGQKCLVSGSPIYDDDNNLKRTIAVVRDVSELDLLMKEIAKEDNLSLSYAKRINTSINYIENDHVVTENMNMKSIYSKIKKIANVDSTVLLLGETGVGKDFIASFIHKISDRSKTGSLIKINCGAIPEHLLESELFGYEEGAFTGAQKGGKKGLFEEANNGTLFLDEIGDMPYTLQVKLLNAINDKKFHRLGGNKSIKFNARIISATNANLEKLIEEKNFRADLYYRLNVINIRIPSLKERREDILPLARNFLEYYNTKYKKSCYFSPDILELFLVYSWHGNIREMKNLIERLVIISDDARIDSNTFNEQVSSKTIKKAFDYKQIIAKGNTNLSLKKRVELFEKSIIEQTIKNSKTLKHAAEKLDIDISTLVRKKQKYSI